MRSPISVRVNKVASEDEVQSFEVNDELERRVCFGGGR